ncbi:MCE1 enzyme, partial [Polypterus senegalus]
MQFTLHRSSSKPAADRAKRSVEAAVAAFAQARQPGIYKADYLKELFQRYGDVEDAPQPPTLPEWCFEDDDDNEDFDDDGNTIVPDTGPSSSNSLPGKKRKERLKLGAVFLEGVHVKGVTQLTAQPKLGEIQRKCQQFCEWEKPGFPGAQPVSMDRKNIKLLEQNAYKVSWKADGTRLTLDIRRLNDWDKFKVWTDDGTGDNYTTQEHYKSKMLKPFTYGSACELMAAAELFCCRFQVYRNGQIFYTFRQLPVPLKHLRLTGDDFSSGHFDVCECLNSQKLDVKLSMKPVVCLERLTDAECHFNTSPTNTVVIETNHETQTDYDSINPSCEI